MLVDHPVPRDDDEVSTTAPRHEIDTVHGPTVTDAGSAPPPTPGEPGYQSDEHEEGRALAVDDVAVPRARRRWNGVTRPLPHGTGAGHVPPAAHPLGGEPPAEPDDALRGDQVWATAMAVRSLTTSVNRFRAALADALEISPTDVLALTEVSLSPGLTPGELADRIAVGIAGTSTVIDRLVKAGFLRRVPAPLDRRTYQLALSPAGVHAVGWAGDATRAAITTAHTTLAASGRTPAGVSFAPHNAAACALPTNAPDDQNLGQTPDAHIANGDDNASRNPDPATTVTHLNALAAAYYEQAQILTVR